MNKRKNEPKKLMNEIKRAKRIADWIDNINSSRVGCVATTLTLFVVLKGQTSNTPLKSLTSNSYPVSAGHYADTRRYLGEVTYKGEDANVRHHDIIMSPVSNLLIKKKINLF